MRLHQAGRLVEAEALYRRILATHPQTAPVLSYLGLIEAKHGRQRGLNRLKQATRLAPEVAIFWLHLGLGLEDFGQLADAELAFRKAISVDRLLADAYLALGSNLRRRGRIDDAISALRSALQLAPDRFEAYVNLGGVLNDAKRFDEAGRVLAEGQRRFPENPFLNFNLGLVLANNNRPEDAIRSFEAAVAARPGYTLADWHAALTLPVMYDAQADIARWRARWRQGLPRLDAAIDLATPEKITAAFRAVESSTNFYLHYQGNDDRELQWLYARLVSRIVRARYPQFVEPLTPRSPGGRIRVVFISHHFRHHSIAKTHAAWATELDRREFEVVVVHTGAERDGATDDIASKVDGFHHRPLIDDSFLLFLRSLNADVIIYPDLGMEPLYQVLASLRLAPVQCNGLGHPITAGFDTIDVALTSAAMEPPDGASHYTERCIMLANTGFRYRRPDIDTSRSFERDPRRTVFVCLQNLTKLLPAQDALFARIAAEVPNAQFWFVESNSSTVSRFFEARMTRAFGAAGVDAADRLRMIPQLGQQEFYAMCRAADVCLDSHAWSGCNTTHEALACGLPVITWPGKMMRGRHTLAILQRAGLTELIADTAERYVALAVELGRDRRAAADAHARVAAQADAIFDDHAPIRDLESFLRDAAGHAV
jgi:protein O-GlcNAc transferase